LYGISIKKVQSGSQSMGAKDIGQGPAAFEIFKQTNLVVTYPKNVIKMLK